MIGRLMVAVWSLFMLLMFCFLNSNLRANIILMPYEPDINTVDDAIERLSLSQFFSEMKIEKNMV